MRVRMLTDRVGFGINDREGDEIDLPEKEARALLAAGQAEEIETAALAPAENAARRTSPPKARNR